MYYNLYKEEQAKEYILVNHNWSRYGTAVFSVKLARPNYTIGYPVLDE